MLILCGPQGRTLKRRHRTAIPDPAAQAVPDLLRRNVTASAPNRAWIGDITYLPIAGGKFLYLATVIDVYSRRLLGWSMTDHMRAELVTDALNAAVRTRGGQVDDVIFHSDHGAQYGSRAFADTCHQAGIRRSMGAVGASADNAAAESFFASLQREILPDRLADRTSRPARSLPPARLLQPPAQALHDRLPRAGRLRTEINYAGHRCMTTGVHDQGGSPPRRAQDEGHPQMPQALRRARGLPPPHQCLQERTVGISSHLTIYRSFRVKLRQSGKLRAVRVSCVWGLLGGRLRLPAR
ncbi:hypothetical protein GCM10010121_090670 [Streptomyces brasiliensis]|uniref:Integrase catalytic domain-containing protein n=1 Tax=Streptomyces brasiliensis TaxID=1954 RepID=A0A917P7T4_9ACTN|nr:hypothetical protein GCM10010121_090670 [Streptomyces brasiliensis]